MTLLQTRLTDRLRVLMASTHTTHHTTASHSMPILHH